MGNHREGRERLDQVAHAIADAVGAPAKAERVHKRLERGAGKTFDAYTRTRALIASNKCGCGCKKPLSDLNLTGYHNEAHRIRACRGIVDASDKE